MAALTPLQERFVAEYLVDQNASAAARRAGYTTKRMSAQAGELMKHPEIRRRIEAGMQEVLGRARAEAAALMKQRERAAFFRAGQLVRDGKAVPPEALDEDARAVVAVRVKQGRRGAVVEMKMPNQERALRELERMCEVVDGVLSGVRAGRGERKRQGCGRLPGAKLKAAGDEAGLCRTKAMVGPQTRVVDGLCAVQKGEEHGHLPGGTSGAGGE